MSTPRSAAVLPLLGCIVIGALSAVAGCAPRAAAPPAPVAAVATGGTMPAPQSGVSQATLRKQKVGD